MLTKTINNLVENMYNSNTYENMYGGRKVTSLNDLSNSELLITTITLIIIYAIILIFGKFLWNKVFIKLFPSVKPATSAWQILGLAILAGLIFQR